jgi:hypothetical protein
MLLSEGTAIPQSSPSVRVSDGELMAAAQRELGLEVSRDSKARGLFYAGARDRASEHAVLAALKGFEGLARVCLLGRRAVGNVAKPAEGNPLVTRIFVDDESEMGSHDVLFYLSERSAYGLIQRANGPIFHTSDAPLVDALVAKLQARYDLQPG